MRCALSVIMALILLRCAFSLFIAGAKKEVWGTLKDKKGRLYSLEHWDNLIGSGRDADVILESETILPVQTAIVRDRDGNWTISDVGGENNTLLRGKRIKKRHKLNSGDAVTLGGEELLFTASPAEQKGEARIEGIVVQASWTSMILLTAFVLTLGAMLIPNLDRAYLMNAIYGFGAVLCAAWLAFAVSLYLKRGGFELEVLAFMLTAMGFAVCLSSDPDDIYKLGLCLLLGTAFYFAVCILIDDQDRVNAMRLPAAVLGLALLALNIVAAESVLGAKNWLSIAGISVQPSEFVKLAFIFAGSVSLERLFAKDNLILFMGFSAVCVGCLAVIGDFGAALVFFAVYLVAAFLRSGSLTAISLSAVGAGLAAFIAVTARPYIAKRFAIWGRVWEDASGLGFQQTRTMTAVASGGLWGVGAGKGWFRTVFASDTDMVFGLVSEEYGFVTAVICVIAVLFFAVYAVKSVMGARSSFYAIAACMAVSFFLASMSLNVFGSLDLLPFTGVTFPFLSKGGSSLIAAWGMLGFVKAADTRRLTGRRLKEGEEQ